MKPLRFHYDNLAKHGVSEQEVEECLVKGKRKVLLKVGRRKYQVIAQTAAGRYLEIIFKELSQERFVFHAMDARARDIKLWRRKGKRQ